MSTKQRDRDEFISIMTKEGVPLHVSRSLMRYAATLQRLSEAQCNGDWPADNGERKVIPCSVCGALWVPSTITRTGCPDCRIERLVTLALVGTGIKPSFHGDPRGCVLRLTMPSGRDSGWGGVGVPA